jgi:5-methylcytosine-specific restriction endonuclease McrA
MESKRCKVCGQIKFINEFYHSKSGRFRVGNICKECIHIDRIIIYRKNRDKNILKSREWALKNKERVKINQAKWYLRNQDRLILAAGKRYEKDPKLSLERGREWAKKHPEKNRAIKSKYKKAHPERVRISYRNRKAFLLNVPGKGWNAFEEKQLIEDYGHRCAYCGELLKKVTMDHIIPISRGGNHEIDNAVPACGYCNSSKGNKPLLIWLYKKRQEWTYEQLGRTSI